MLPRSNTTQPCGKAEPYLENIPHSHGGEEKNNPFREKLILFCFLHSVRVSHKYICTKHNFRVLSLRYIMMWIIFDTVPSIVVKLCFGFDVALVMNQAPHS